MELGEKLRLARQEAGLSQRALCADRITRNMLSQIEHGTAKPSMQTLQYLAERLEKPVSYFLGEAAVTPNQVAMGKARQAYGQKNYREALLALDAYVSPDESLDWERGLLGYLCCLGQAEQAAREGREPVAAKWLSRSRLYESPYLTEELLRRREQLSLRLGGREALAALPSLDEELLFRAKAALKAANPDRARQLLEATEKREGDYYCLLGRILYTQSSYAQAAEAFRQAERFGQRCDAYLEACYRELGDFEKAYRYAVRRR